MADKTGLHINAFAFLDLDFLGQPGDLGVALDFLGHLRFQFDDFFSASEPAAAALPR